MQMDSSDNTNAPKFRGWVVRAALSGIVLALIFSFLPIGDVLAAARRIDASLWLTSLAILCIGHVISAAKWQLLADSGAGFGAVLRAHFGGLVANLCLPGVMSGDVVRAALLFPRVQDRTRLALGSFADRLIDSIGLLILAMGGLALTLREFPSGLILLFGIVAIVAAATLAAAVCISLHPVILRRLRQGSQLHKFAEKFGLGIGALLREPRALLLCLALSTAVQGAFIGVNIALAQAAGVAVPIAAWFFAWPLSKIIASLPLSLAGLGVREASLAGLLAPFGAAPVSVVATGLLWWTLHFATGLISGAILVLSGIGLAPARATIPQRGAHE
jgi:glycosyltransferase 2 family protein